MKNEILTIDENVSDFSDEIRKNSSIHFNHCYQCMSCTNGCPFLSAMDIPPNRLIRMVQFGLMDQVLKSTTIWTCVGCNTCSSQCPMLVDMGGLMDALRQKAMEMGITPAQPDVLKFHQEVLSSVERYGRTHKLEIMLRYKMKTGDWFGDMDVGLRMLAKRKLDLTPSKVKNISAIKKLFNNPRTNPRGVFVRRLLFTLVT